MVNIFHDAIIRIHDFGIEKLLGNMGTASSSVYKTCIRYEIPRLIFPDTD